LIQERSSLKEQEQWDHNLGVLFGGEYVTMYRFAYGNGRKRAGSLLSFSSICNGADQGRGIAGWLIFGVPLGFMLFVS
jgi:hypothetical protein